MCIMAGKQAKVLSNDNIGALLTYAASRRHALRDIAIVLLSVRAGLRAGEIAKLTWPMVLDADGDVAFHVELHDKAAKKGSGRRIPLHNDVRFALASLRAKCSGTGPVIVSERAGGPMRATSMVLWFCRAYRVLGMDGCSSHSGRRTFITKAARLVHKAGGSLRDVQLLAGHRSIQTTQRYIDGDSDAQRRLVSLL
jgi:integrase/recombinase XerD